MPDGDLVSFRFEVTARRLVEITDRTYSRLLRFVMEQQPWEQGANLAQHHDYARDMVIVTGELPQPAVTALQALAMGHDLGAVLDLLGADPIPERIAD